MLTIARRKLKELKARVTGTPETPLYQSMMKERTSISALDAARAIHTTQFLDNPAQPIPLDLPESGPIMVLAPHQDDEVIGAGGVMLLARKQGIPVHVVFMTDGRSKKDTVYGTPDQVVTIRRQESDAVCERLSAQAHRLDLNNAELAPKVDDVRALAQIVNRVKPAVLLVPWLLDIPKHRVTNHLLWLADRLHPLTVGAVWGYQVHNELLPNGYVDFTDVAREKRELLEIYKSQMENVRRYDHMAMGLAAWNCRFLKKYKGDPVPRYVETFCVLPLREHLNLVESFYFENFDDTYRGMVEVPELRRLHEEIVVDPAHRPSTD